MPQAVLKVLRGGFDRLKEIVTRRDIEYSELQGGLIAVLWGLWSLFPGCGVCAEAPPEFVSLVEVFPLGLWGMVFVAVGLAQLLALLHGGTRTRRVLALLAASLWLFVGVILWRVPSQPPGSFPFVVMFAVGAAYGYLRIPHVSPSGGHD